MLCAGDDCCCCCCCSISDRIILARVTTRPVSPGACEEAHCPVDPVVAYLSTSNTAAAAAAAAAAYNARDFQRRSQYFFILAGFFYGVDLIVMPLEALHFLFLLPSFFSFFSFYERYRLAERTTMLLSNFYSLFSKSKKGGKMLAEKRVYHAFGNRLQISLKKFFFLPQRFCR